MIHHLKNKTVADLQSDFKLWNKTAATLCKEDIQHGSSFKRASVGYGLPVSSIGSGADGDSRILNTSERVEIGAVRQSRDKLCSPRPQIIHELDGLNQKLQGETLDSKAYLSTL